MTLFSYKLSISWNKKNDFLKNKNMILFYEILPFYVILDKLKNIIILLYDSYEMMENQKI